MGKIKNLFRKLRWSWLKNLITAIVIIVAVGLAQSVVDETLQDLLPIGFLIGAVFFLLAAIGFVFMILEKIGKVGSSIAKGVKKVASNASKAVGTSSSAKKSNKKDDVVTLLSAKGEEIDFIEIAGIAYRGNFYAILQPVELLEGMSDDEALVFKVSRNKDGSDKFEIELDDNVVNAVFREYDKLYAQAHKR